MVQNLGRGTSCCGSDPDEIGSVRFHDSFPSSLLCTEWKWRYEEERGVGMEEEKEEGEKGGRGQRREGGGMEEEREGGGVVAYKGVIDDEWRNLCKPSL